MKENTTIMFTLVLSLSMRRFPSKSARKGTNNHLRIWTELSHCLFIFIRRRSKNPNDYSSAEIWSDNTLNRSILINYSRDYWGVQPHSRTVREVYMLESKADGSRTRRETQGHTSLKSSTSWRGGWREFYELRLSQPRKRIVTELNLMIPYFRCDPDNPGL